MNTVILASASPRRRELLSKIVPEFTVEVSRFDESAVSADRPELLVQRLAEGKCMEVVARYPDCVVVGSDTVVAVDGLVLGKPHSREDAARMLHLLSGHTHQVHTGVCIACGEQKTVFCSTALVTFERIEEKDLEEYLNTDEPYDKAGAYAIQGHAAVWCSAISGDYYTIMGLPVCRLAQELKVFEF